MINIRTLTSFIEAHPPVVEMSVDEIRPYSNPRALLNSTGPNNPPLALITPCSSAALWFSDHHRDVRVGIEVEAEMDPGADTSSAHDWVSSLPATNTHGWNVGGDGSLRHGVEFCTASNRVGMHPTYQQVRRDLLYMERDFLERYCYQSWRAAFQMHFSIETATLNTLRSWLLCYLILEPYIFGVLGHGRWQSNFCVPLAQQPDLLASLYDGFDDVCEVEAFLCEWPKYSAVNLSTILSLGTVELRHAITPVNNDDYGLLDLGDLFSAVRSRLQHHMPGGSIESVVNSYRSLTNVLNFSALPVVPELVEMRDALITRLEATAPEISDFRRRGVRASIHSIRELADMIHSDNASGQ